MVGGKKDERPQGFVIVLENCNDRRGKHWSRVYLSKIGEPKFVEICEPNRLEIMTKVQRLLILNCRRVVLLAKTHPVGTERGQMIRNIKGYYPEVEVVGMTYL